MSRIPVPSAQVARLAAAIDPAEPNVGALSAEDRSDLPQLLENARMHGVDALTAAALMEDASLDAGARAHLHRRLLARQAEWGALARVLEQVERTLKAIDVPLVALKGAALAVSVYDKPALRPMGDLDILIPPERRDDAMVALTSAGYLLPDADDRTFWSQAYYNLPVFDLGPERIPIDVHWRIAQPDRHPIPVEPLFDRSVTAMRSGIRIMEPIDQILHLALHLAYHTFVPKLIWLYDLAVVFARIEHEQALLERAREWQMTVPLALTIRHVEKVFPRCVPDTLSGFARRSLRTRTLLGLTGSRDPIELIAGAHARPMQLFYGFAMLDRFGQALSGVTGWARRSLRFGEAAGHEKLRELSEQARTHRAAGEPR